MRTLAVILSIGVATLFLAGCRPAPHPVERVEVVTASLAEAPLLALDPAKAQSALAAKLVPERGFRRVPGTLPASDHPVRLTLEVDLIREQVNPAGLPALEEVTASLNLRRNTEEGVERIVVQATRNEPVTGVALEGRQEAARRALDQAMDRLVTKARAYLDARNQSDRRLQQDLQASDALVREAAVSALVQRRNRAAIPALVAQLKGEDPLEVRRAMGGLVELQAREAVPELIEISRGKDPGFLRELVYALGAIGGDEAQAYLYTLSQGHDQPAVRDAARQALEELNRHSRRSVAPAPRNAWLLPRGHTR
jgi:hypothetical protein